MGLFETLLHRAKDKNTSRARCRPGRTQPMFVRLGLWCHMTLGTEGHVRYLQGLSWHHSPSSSLDSTKAALADGILSMYLLPSA